MLYTLSLAIIGAIFWFISPSQASENTALACLNDLRKQLISASNLEEQKAVALSMTKLLGTGDYQNPKPNPGTLPSIKSYGIRKAPAATQIEKAFILYAISYLSQLGLSNTDLHKEIEDQLKAAETGAKEAWKKTHIQLVHIAYEFFKMPAKNLSENRVFISYYGNSNNARATTIIRYFNDLGPLNLDRLFPSETETYTLTAPIQIPAGQTIKLKKPFRSVKQNSNVDERLLEQIWDIAQTKAKMNHIDPAKFEEEIREKKRKLEEEKRRIDAGANSGWDALIRELEAFLAELEKKKGTVTFHVGEPQRS